MKIFLLLLFLSLYGKIDSEIWIEYRPLTWADFRAKPYMEGISARLCSTIKLLPAIRKGKYYFEIKAMFAPDSSFTCTQSEEVLRHENVHFSITYIFAKVFADSIAAFQGCDRSGYNQVISAYYRVSDAMQAYQNLYDSESDHSRNSLEQLRWEIFINALLKKFQNGK